MWAQREEGHELEGLGSWRSSRLRGHDELSSGCELASRTLSSLGCATFGCFVLGEARHGSLLQGLVRYCFPRGILVVPGELRLGLGDLGG